MNILIYIFLWFIGIASGDNKWNSCMNITSGDKGICLLEKICLGFGGLNIGTCTSSVKVLCCKISVEIDNTAKDALPVIPSNTLLSYEESKTYSPFSRRKLILLDPYRNPQNTVDIFSNCKQFNNFQRNFSDNVQGITTDKPLKTINHFNYSSDDFRFYVNIDQKLYTQNVSLQSKQYALKTVENDPILSPIMSNQYYLPHNKKFNESKLENRKELHVFELSVKQNNHKTFKNLVQKHVIKNLRKPVQKKSIFYTKKSVSAESIHRFQKQVFTGVKKTNDWNIVNKKTTLDSKRPIIPTVYHDFKHSIQIYPTNVSIHPNNLRKPVQTDITFYLQKPVQVDPSHNLHKLVNIPDSHDIRWSTTQNLTHRNTENVLRESVKTDSTFYLRKPVQVDPSFNFRKPVKVSETHDLQKPVLQESDHNLRNPVNILREPVKTDSTFYLRKPVQVDPSFNLRKPVKISESHDLRRPVIQESDHDLRNPVNIFREPVKTDSTFYLRKPVQVDPSFNLRKPVKISESHDLRWPVIQESDHDLRNPVNVFREPVKTDSTFYLRKPVQVDPSFNLRKPVKISESHDLRWPVMQESDHDLRNPIQEQVTDYIHKPVEDDSSHGLRKAVQVADSQDLRWPREQYHDLRNPVADIDYFRSENAETKLVKIIQAYIKKTSKDGENKENSDPIYELLYEDDRIKSNCENEFWNSNNNTLQNRDIQASKQQVSFRNTTKACGIPYNESNENFDLQERNSVGPWMVSVQEYVFGKFRHKCGGSLLNNIWVITAAHCVDLRPKWDFLLKFGTENNGESQNTIERLVNKISIHPKYNNMNFDNDIALLRMEQPVTFKSNIFPICLPHSHDSMEKRIAVVFGWQVETRQKMTSGVAQAETVPVLTDKECEVMFSETGVNENIENNFVCAGARSVKESCTGDSGGPMAVLDKRGRWSLAGLYSWGKTCKIPNQPEVYISVTSYINWIEDTITCFEHNINLNRVNG